MAEKMDVEEARRILQRGGFDLNPQPADHTATWTDGLPHDFSGWGSHTPDPDHPSPAIDLAFTGEASSEHHHVWRFEMRRRHH
jgi:hypothetical protein